MTKKTFLVALGVFLFATTSAAGADFNGDGRDDVAVYRPSNGLWNIRGVSRFYFGTAADTPFATDIDGNGIADPAYCRSSNGFWKVRSLTQFYFGNAALGDTRISGGGGGQHTYDYVVKAGDGADLLAALESTSHTSVFVPAGTYYVYEMIDVTTVKRIVGEALHGYTLIQLLNGQYLNITSQGCSIEGLMIQGGGDSTSGIGNFYVNNAWYVTLRDCYSLQSAGDGFEYTSGSHYVSFINCNAEQADIGFDGHGDVHTSRLIGCTAEDCTNGFESCNNLSACTSEDSTGYGFDHCDNVSSCTAKGPSSGGVAFHNCKNITACRAYAVGGSAFFACDRVSSCSVNTASSGFENCSYISSSTTYSCVTDFPGCYKIDSDSCNYP